MNDSDLYVNYNYTTAFHATHTILFVALNLCTCRSVQECVQRHGGGEVKGVWYGGDVPIFQLNFWTKMGLKKLLENQCDLRKELMKKIASMLTIVYS